MAIALGVKDNGCPASNKRRSPPSKVKGPNSKRILFWAAMNQSNDSLRPAPQLVEKEHRAAFSTSRTKSVIFDRDQNQSHLMGLILSSHPWPELAGCRKVGFRQPANPSQSHKCPAQCYCTTKLSRLSNWRCGVRTSTVHV